MEKHLRILLITLNYPPPVLGGYGVMCAQVANFLSLRGHEVLVLTRSQEEQESSRVKREVKGTNQVWRVLRSYWDGSGGLTPSLPEALRIEQHTGLPTRLPDLGKIGIFCFVSAWTRQRAEQRGGWRFLQADVIPPGFSPTDFPSLTHQPDHPWRWRLLWVGRVIEEKGVETAIKALPYMPPQATLTIVGPVAPAYRRHLEALATALRRASQLTFTVAVSAPDAFPLPGS
jgi:glycosyltransferase involved in cell wall biosynthesis